MKNFLLTFMMIGIVGCAEEKFNESFLCFDAENQPSLFAERIDENFFDVRFYNANGERKPDEYTNNILESKYRIIFDGLGEYHLAQEAGGFRNLFILTPAFDGGELGSKFSYPAEVKFTSLAVTNFTGWRQIFRNCNYIPD